MPEFASVTYDNDTLSSVIYHTPVKSTSGPLPGSIVVAPLTMPVRHGSTSNEVLGAKVMPLKNGQFPSRSRTVEVARLQCSHSFKYENTYTAAIPLVHATQKAQRVALG